MSRGTVLWGQVQEDWFLDVNRFSRATSWLHAPVRGYAEYGVVLFAALLLGSWWLARRGGDPRRVAASLWAPVGALVAIGVNQVIAGAVAAPRPYTVLPDALVLVSRSADPSFPSDHAVMAGAVAAGLFVAHRGLGAVAAVLAIAMALTRVYVGVHFPLDVAAGLVIGAGIAWLSYVILASRLSRLVGVLANTPVRPLLIADGADR